MKQKSRKKSVSKKEQKAINDAIVSNIMDILYNRKIY
jgi:hypothetical protein